MMRAALILACGAQLCACSNGDLSGSTCNRAQSGPSIFSDGYDRSVPEPQWTTGGPAGTSASIDDSTGCPAPALRLTGSANQQASARTSASFASSGRTFSIDMTLDPDAGSGATSTFTVIQSADSSNSMQASFTIAQDHIEADVNNGQGGGVSGSPVANRGQLYHVTFSIDASGFGYIAGDDGEIGNGNGASGFGSTGNMIMKVASNAGWFDNAAVTEP